MRDKLNAITNKEKRYHLSIINEHFCNKNKRIKLKLIHWLIEWLIKAERKHYRQQKCQLNYFKKINI